MADKQLLLILDGAEEADDLPALLRIIGSCGIVITTREREVIKMRYGIGYDDSFTLDYIGQKFGLTRERIRQIEKQTIMKLKKSHSSEVLKSLYDNLQ